MNNQAHYSTLEPVGGQTDHQPDLEATTNHTSPEILHKAEYDNFPVENTTGKDERRILGLKRRLFFIVAGLLSLLVVGAIVGGAVGGTRGKNKAKTILESPESTPAPPTQPAPTPDNPNSNNTGPISSSNLMINSQLASVNWTDDSKIQHRAVFYQNKVGGLTVTLWDSQKKSWAPSPVSTPDTPIVPRNGTAIAAAVDNIRGFQLNVYFYTDNGKIVEFYTRDQQAPNWWSGDLTKESVDGHLDSKLAAYFQVCDGCINQTIVAYQEPLGSPNSQKVRYRTSADWSKAGDVFENSMTAQTGISFIPYKDNNLKLYAENNKITHEISKAGNKSWETVVTLETKSEQAKQFAALPMKNGNKVFGDIFLTTLYQNDTIGGQWAKNDQWGTPFLPNFNGSETRTFKAIAMNQDRRFYGISEGQIHEFTIDGQDPHNWNYTGVVGS
ncbi:hypothetical protein HYFRA_00005674 [Hymenoscyphus fraxineus]|uniref:Fucose-specific lectin n=1 Tax=Hymenoscyphus fraxineus TaxID=746836 RepID=A0A9N9KTJ7_9HELO|nr:hypothetical protein HYFRA_00005674 [Hymenoscyphus fraxineus]